MMGDHSNGACIPCHVVAGSLGAGKTTTILNYLKERAGCEEIAVIVNDFGKAGLDATILKEAGGTREVRNIPGGCLCCSSIHDMREAFLSVLQRQGLSRIIIEPSGLAIMPDLVPYLQRLCEEFNLELRPVIALLNPKRTKEAHYISLPFFGTLVDHADILVANRVDECSAEHLAHFREWTARLRPAKLRVVETSFGALPPELFDLSVGTKAAELKFYAPHTHEESSGGFVGEIPAISESAFSECIENWIQEGVAGAQLLRFKSLLPTDGGWRLFEIAQGQAYVREMPEATKAQLDWISRGVVAEASIRSCLAACSR